jgi:hypothetical protein
MAKSEVRVLLEPEYRQWDQLVEHSEQGTIFHSSSWIAAAAKMLALDFILIGVFKNSELIGGCSFYRKNLFFGYRIAYTANTFSPYGGFVLENPASTQVRENETRHHEIISLILEKIQTMNLAKINFINGPGLSDIRPFTRTGWKGRVYYTYIVPLENDIFSSISYGARRSIRKAQKLGISVKKEYNPDIFWNLAQATYAKQAMPVPYKKDHIVAFMEMMNRNNLGDMWIAKTPSGEPVSAVFYAYDPQMAHGWLGANDPAFKDTGSVSFILFESLAELQKRGFQRFNIMAANTPHLAQFYSSFNPRLVPYYGVEKINRLGKLSNMFRSDT